MPGNQHENDRRMIQYLLGTLAEEERTRLEDDYFADDTLFEELAAVEAELIDAYVGGELAGSERAQFEERYLASSEQRARIAFARQLIEKPDKTPSQVTETDIGWWRRARTALDWRQPIFAAAFAVAVLAIVVSAVWRIYRPASPPVPTQAQRTQPATEPVPATLPPATTAERQPQSGRGTAAVDAIALVLAPGLTRSPGEGGAVLAIGPGTKTVRIQLDHEGEGYASYRAVLRTPEGQEVWRQRDVAPLRRGAKSVVIIIPAASLRPGDYVVTLSGIPPSGPVEDVADYAFRVVKQ